jgi:hypothetical protein
MQGCCCWCRPSRSLSTACNGCGSVNRWLEQIPESVTRLDLEGLEVEQRRQAIEQWYKREQRLLRAQTPTPENKARVLLQQRLDALEQQRNVLLSAVMTTPD